MSDQTEAGSGEPASVPAGHLLAPAAGDVVSAAIHAELSSIVLAGRPLGAVMRRVAELAVKAIPGAEEASVTLIERGRPRTVAFSGRLAAALDERQYEAGFGPCLDAAYGGQVVHLDIEDATGPYRDFASQARRHGVRQVLAVGLPTLQQTTGALNLYTNAGPFTQAARDGAVAFAGYAAATLFNATDYAGALDTVAQMREAMASRAVIEQAKGIIMARERCSADEAFTLLVTASSLNNRKLREIAAEIVGTVTRK